MPFSTRLAATILVFAVAESPGEEPRTAAALLPGSRPAAAEDLSRVSSRPADSAPASSRPALPATLTLDLGGGVNMELVLIPAGEFISGSPPGEAGHDEDENPQTRVTIGKPFYMGKHEVTESQWLAVIGSIPSTYPAGANYPVKNTSWDTCMEFCRKLSQKVGREIRLPTEAEWEYACRAGTRTAYSFGDSPDRLGDYAWFGANSGGKIHPVAVKKPNAWGLYDMQGNVWEWCQDWYDRYPGSTTTREDFGQRLRVMRGGSWVAEPGMCRAAFRGAGIPDDRYTDDRGLRVVSAAGM